jgi:hypothetical protein
MMEVDHSKTVEVESISSSEQPKDGPRQRSAKAKNALRQSLD